MVGLYKSTIPTVIATDVMGHDISQCASRNLTFGQLQTV